MIHKYNAPLLVSNRLTVEQRVPASPCVRHVLERVQGMHMRACVAPRQVGVHADYTPPQRGLQVQEGSAARATAELEDGACRGQCER